MVLGNLEMKEKNMFAMREFSLAHLNCEAARQAALDAFVNDFGDEA